MRPFSKLVPSSILILLFFISFSVPGYAEYTTIGARAFGVGNAMTALADDVTAIVYNPAALSRTSFDAHLGLQSNRLDEALKLQGLLDDPEQLNEETLNLALSAFSGVSFASYGIGLDISGHLDAKDAGCEGGATYCTDGDMMVRIMAAAAFEPSFLSLPGVHMGVTYSHYSGLRSNFAVNEQPGVGYSTSLTEQTGQGGSIGMGVLFTALPTIDLGLAVDNVFSNIAWTGTKTVIEYDNLDNELTNTPTTLPDMTEKLDTVVRAGAALRVPLTGITIAADAGSDGSFGIGAEKSLLANAISLRAGYNSTSDQAVTTFGIGVHLGPARLDLSTATEDFQDFGIAVSGAVRF